MKHEIRQVAFLRPETDGEYEALCVVMADQQLPDRVGVILDEVIADTSEVITSDNVIGGLIYVNRESDPHQWDEVITKVRALSESAGDALKALTDADYDISYVWFEKEM